MEAQARDTAQTGVALTASAARKVRQLAEAQGDAGLLLRVYIEGGGCSGFQYGFEFAETPDEGDAVVETDGVRMVVDPMSFQYLLGAEVDFKEDLQGARFVVSNPNASTTCGCGSSFGV